MSNNSHHSSSNTRSFLSDDRATNTSDDLCPLNIPQDEYIQRQVSRESQLLDGGDEPPPQNRRPSKKELSLILNTSKWQGIFESKLLDDCDELSYQDQKPATKDFPWYRQGYYASMDASLQKVHLPESGDTSDFGLWPKMTRYCSQGTPPPPPPGSRSKPGAVYVPGFQADPTSDESTSPSLPGKSSAPVLQASVVVEQEQPSSPNGRSKSLPVLAEPMWDEDSTKRPGCAVPKDRRLMVILVILVVAVLGFGIGMGIVLTNKESTTTTTVEYVPATLAPTAFTKAPSPSPTQTPEFVAPEFSPPSPAQCQLIESGNAVPNQDRMIQKTYQVELDIVMESNVESLDNHFATLVDRMQASLAPKLAQCDHANQRKLIRAAGDTRIHRGSNRRLLRNYLIVNAQFSHSLPISNRSCKVIETIKLYIQQDESDVRLIGRIMDVFDAESLVQQLDLGRPFKSITMIGVTSNTDSNIIADSPVADLPDAESPDDDED